MDSGSLAIGYLLGGRVRRPPVDYATLRGVFLFEHENRPGFSPNSMRELQSRIEVPRTISYGRATLEDPLCHRVF